VTEAPPRGETILLTGPPLAGKTSALLDRRSAYRDRGIDLVVVSGDLIDGSITAKLLDRVQPGLIDDRRRDAGYLPTVQDFAAEVAAVALAPSPEKIVFVGETR
jgi:hypothetical protein